MAPISMKTKTTGPLSPGTTSSGQLRRPSAMPSFRAVEKMAQDIQKKYDRPADVKGFMDRSRMYQEGLRAGAVPQAGADGIMRLNLVNKGVKDPVTGATILSMQSPQMTAVAPTFGQLAGDIGRGLGSMLEGGFNFITKGGVTGQLLQGAKDLFTDPVGTAKRVGYGIKDMTQGYDPFTKQGVGETQKITTESLPSLDLEAKMSAYEDPIKYYAGRQKADANQVGEGIKYLNDVKSTMVADAGDATQKYMNLLKNVQNLGKTKYGTFGVQDILSNPTLTYEKEMGPGTLSTKIGDNQAEARYSILFNKGGRVRGTGIMGALR
jgi:hypothetical protein